jgi:radical SAM superfamily enzyme YgiQ (UPF0313 family)
VKVALINPSIPRMKLPADLFGLLKAKAEALLLVYKNIIQDSGKEIKLQPDIYQISEGLLSIASVAEDAGYFVEYFQQDFLMDINQWNNTIKTIASDFDIVGITVLTPSYPSVIKIIKELKSMNPEIFVIGGGPHVSICDIEAVNDGFDAIIRGEGEIVFAELLRALENPVEIEKIHGLTHKVGNKICRHKDNIRYLEGKDFPIPAFELIPPELRKVSTSRISSSRGCDNSCLFCFESRYWKGIRIMSQDRFMECIEKFTNYSKFNSIELSDSSFGARYKETMELLRRIIKEDYNMFFACEMRADNINRSIVNQLEKAGFIGVFVGVESGSMELLKKMGKNETPSIILKALNILKGKIPVVHTSWMIGFPGENYVTLNETYTFLERICQNELTLESRPRVFIPYPGTPIFKEPQRFGMTITTRDWEKYTRFSFPPIHRLRNMSELEIWSAFLCAFNIGLKYICSRAGIDPLDYIDVNKLVSFEGHYGQYEKLAKVD